MEFWRRFSLPPPYSSGSNEFSVSFAVDGVIWDFIAVVLIKGRHFGHAQATGTIYVLLDDASVATTAAFWMNTAIVVGKSSDRSSVSGICKNWLGYATQWYI